MKWFHLYEFEKQVKSVLFEMQTYVKQGNYYNNKSGEWWHVGQRLKIGRDGGPWEANNIPPPDLGDSYKTTCFLIIY